MTEGALISILMDIHNTAFFSGLRKSDDEFLDEWKDENPFLAFCLCGDSEVEEILKKLYESGYSDGTKGIGDTGATTWAKKNKRDYNKLVSLLCD